MERMLFKDNQSDSVRIDFLILFPMNEGLFHINHCINN